MLPQQGLLFSFKTLILDPLKSMSHHPLLSTKHPLLPPSRNPKRTTTSIKKINLLPSSLQVPLSFPPTPPATPAPKTVTDFHLLEYLSHGYTLTDQALQKAVDYDHTHGLSKRFYSLLNTALGTAHGVDQKLGVTTKAVAVDEKYAIHERAKSTATGLMRYFENALGTPTGKRVRTFYDDRKKEVLDIHAEARRYYLSYG